MEHLLQNKLEAMPFGVVLGYGSGVVALVVCLFALGKKVLTMAERYRKVKNKKAEQNTALAKVQQELSRVEQTVNALQLAICWMLGDRLCEKMKGYYQLGYVPEEEFNELCHMHLAYQGVGGNSTVEEKYHKCLQDLEVQSQKISQK